MRTNERGNLPCINSWFPPGGVTQFSQVGISFLLLSPRFFFPFFISLLLFLVRTTPRATVTRGSAIQDVTMSNSLSLPPSSPFFFLQKRLLFLGWPFHSVRFFITTPVLFFSGFPPPPFFDYKFSRHVKTTRVLMPVYCHGVYRCHDSKSTSLSPALPPIHVFPSPFIVIFSCLTVKTAPLPTLHRCTVRLDYTFSKSEGTNPRTGLDNKIPNFNCHLFVG